MPTKPLSTDLVAITTLGLLAERPRHPYEMQRLITSRQKTFVRGLPRSLYHAIDRLSKAGLVVAGETSREGRRPERTVYEITEAGLEELESWLAALLATPSATDPEAFNAALSLIPYVDEKDALAALRSRVVALEMELAGSIARMEGLRPMLPRLLMLEEEHRIAMVGAERDYTAALVGELEAGTITWDREALRRMGREGLGDDDLARLREAMGAVPPPAR